VLFLIYYELFFKYSTVFAQVIHKMCINNLCRDNNFLRKKKVYLDGELLFYYNCNDIPVKRGLLFSSS